MNNENKGSLIRSLRIEKGMTQLQLAEMLNISDKAVSKWERGKGCPDIELIPKLSDILGADVRNVIEGTGTRNTAVCGNLNKMSVYVCQCCGNITLCTGNAAVSCCSRTLLPLTLTPAETKDCLIAEQVEDEWYITCADTMTKEDYISFVAFVTSERAEFYKLYPEWDVQLRIPKREKGRLVWYRTTKGLLYMDI